MFEKSIFEKLPLRVVVFEDTPAEQIVAGKALEAVGLKCEIIDYFDLNAISDDSSVIGVLTDVFLSTEPEGFGIAAYCAKHNIPCCVVTQEANHNFAGWQKEVLDIWDALNIQIFVSTTSPKKWESAALYLAQKIHVELLKSLTPLGKSYQRYFYHLTQQAE